MRLTFFDRLDVTKFENYAKFLPQPLSDSFFDLVQLQQELFVLYVDKILDDSKTPFEMLKFILTKKQIFYKTYELFFSVYFQLISGTYMIKKLFFL